MSRPKPCRFNIRAKKEKRTKEPYLHRHGIWGFQNVNQNPGAGQQGAANLRTRKGRAPTAVETEHSCLSLSGESVF